MISKREKNKYFNIVLIVLVIVLLVILQRPIRSFFYNLGDNIQQTLWERGRWFGSKKLRIENQELKDINEELLVKVIELNELKKQNEDFRKALDLELNDDFTFIEARVLSKVNDKEVLIINKGSDDGVDIGMTVIDFEKVLIGRITEVFNKTSQLILITDPDIKFGASVHDPGIRAMILGSKDDLELDLVPNFEELNIGDVVYTSYNQDVFPPNLLVGKVSRAEKSDLTSFYEARVIPFFDDYSLVHVLIIR